MIDGVEVFTIPRQRLYSNKTERCRENKITDYKCVETMAFGISKEVPEAIFFVN